MIRTQNGYNYNMNACNCPSEMGSYNYNDTPAIYETISGRAMPVLINQDTPPPSLIEQLLGVQQGQPVVTADVSMGWPTVIKIALGLTGAITLGNIISKNL